MQFGQVGEAAVKGLSHGGIEGIYRAVAFGHLVPDKLSDADFHGRLGANLAVVFVFHGYVIAYPLEMRPERAHAFAHEQVERGVGGLELVAGVFHGNHLCQDLLHEFGIGGDIMPAGEGFDVRSAG